jgi:hypothetical protein
MKDIELAAALLEEENLTLGIVKDEKVIFSSSDKGISPLYKAVMHHKQELEGSSVADRVTGRAAAMLCVYAGVIKLKTRLISDNAISVLKESNIDYEFEKQTPYIKNRDNTGMCPVENLSLKTNNISELLKEIENFIKSIQK